MAYCTNCGHNNPEGSNFCGQCGTPLTAPGAVAEQESATDTTRTMPAATFDDRDPEALTPEDDAAVKALPHGSALLVVRRGANAGSRFLLNTDVVTAGRHQDSDIFLDDISVSRRHATFTRSADGMILRDLGSLNGTYVNRELVEETTLAQGDEVQIGKFRLVFYASGQDTA